jgi:parallel beta-helix repeat protein
VNVTTTPTENMTKNITENITANITANITTPITETENVTTTTTEKNITTTQTTTPVIENISACGALSSSNTVYILTQDITDYPRTCITFEADNITLDCQGHRIDGTTKYGIGMYYGVYAKGKSNSTIRNCNISDFYYGIYFDSSSNNVISNVTLKSHWKEGIYLLYSSSNILSNIIANSNDDCGISLYSSSSNILSNITTNSNYNSGIIISFSDNNTLFNVTTNFNGEDGVNLFTSSFNTLSNIIAKSNARSGINLQSTNFIITGNEKMTDNNKIYNCFFNNTNNIKFNHITQNVWNTTLSAGPNIVGGPYIGGNFYATPSGKGFSEMCTDSDRNGVCDSSYTISGENIDYLPLAYPR